MPQFERNGHRMHYEVHGQGEPALLMGGWGTFCHGEDRHLPQGLTDRYSVIVFDYRGIGESSDDLSIPSSTRLFADDAIALLNHLGVTRVHLIGLIGMGAAIAQEIAINRPDLVRSMVNTGAWLNTDRFLTDQLNMFRFIHRDMGFLAFQGAVSVLSFEPAYYNKNIDRLLGEQGVWHHLNGRLQTHERFIAACTGHDTRDRAGQIKAPTFVLHAEMDQVTGPRTTRPIQDAIPNAEGHVLPDAAHVIAGSRLKQKFGEILLEFLGRH
jgi:3-oxoadipate enol-lactonase